jgi:hypothetical protein
VHLVAVMGVIVVELVSFETTMWKVSSMIMMMMMMIVLHFVMN